jgi:hypothetical protein
MVLLNHFVDYSVHLISLYHILILGLYTQLLSLLHLVLDLGLHPEHFHLLGSCLLPGCLLGMLVPSEHLNLNLSILFLQ